MSTENIAHEKRYRDWWAQYNAMFAPENRSPQQDEQFPLTEGYSIRSKAYIYDGDLHLCGSESELLDKEGKVRYAWRNLDTDGEFCSLFRHRNGKHYLISAPNCMDTVSWRWRADGRCTMSQPVSTRRRGRKPKKCSSGPARTMTPARICWLSPAASGPVPTPPSCWTFPAHSSPSPPERWLDLRNIVDPDDTRFDDIEFVRWESDSLLLRGCDTEDGRWKEVRVPVEQLRAEL